VKSKGKKQCIRFIPFTFEEQKLKVRTPGYSVSTKSKGFVIRKGGEGDGLMSQSLMEKAHSAQFLLSRF
jgi:hypothetical protein